jgi:hypothetical protein
MPDPYFSEIKYLGVRGDDFIEVAVDAGADVSTLVVTIYNSNGTVRSTNPVAGLTPTTIAGKDVYVIDTGSPTFNGLGKTNGLSLSDGATVYDFFSFDDLATPITATAGAASGMTSTQIGMAGAGESLETSDGGATYNVQTMPSSGSVPCLTAGTDILTLQGAVKVENLAPGMQIATFNNEHVSLLSIFRRKVTPAELTANPKLYPVRILRGALGNNLPKEDLIVSRQHSMLVSSKIAERMFGVRHALISAIKLTELPGIYVDDTVDRVEYFHLLFDKHEVIFAEGAPTESMFTGPEALKSVNSEAREEILTILPELADLEYTPESAQFVPSGKLQKKLMERHLKNAKPLLAWCSGVVIR